MNGELETQRPRLHPAHHWGPFATNPWSPDLDPVTGPAWDIAVRAGRLSIKPSSKATARPGDETKDGQGPTAHNQ
jgi:hypothetical protein